MRALVDSHVLIWWLEGPERVAAPARAVIATRENEVYFSAASIWELGLKQAKGKLRLPDLFVDLLTAEGFRELPVTVPHAHRAFALPRLHHDPFDRMLLAQAQHEGLLFLTRDAALRAYPVPTMPA